MNTARSLPLRRVTLTVAAATILSVAASAGAGVPPNYSWNFATITHPGNRLPTLAEYGANVLPRVEFGRVDYTYRIATTEVTGRQWHEFVQAYAPFVDPNFVEFRGFNGAASEFLGYDNNGTPVYRLNDLRADVAATEISWRFAARFVNWLHNGKPTGQTVTRDAFERGAYDTSTFFTDPKTGVFTDQRRRSDGARFWIPSVDEWVKAAYFDPNRYGPGQAGYWRYPISQNTPPTPGLPGQPGAQSAAGLGTPPQLINSGSYPDVRSPWGLLDTSGGALEWCEDANPFGATTRLLRGSWDFAGGLSGFEQLYDTLSWPPNEPLLYAGLRIASAVPAPGPAIVLFAGGGAIFYRRRIR